MSVCDYIHITKILSDIYTHIYICCSFLFIDRIDVMNAFLNGDLHEEVCMTPLGVIHQFGEVCRLCKALYGLKQESCAWLEKFSILIHIHLFYS